MNHDGKPLMSVLNFRNEEHAISVSRICAQLTPPGITWKAYLSAGVWKICPVAPPLEEDR